MKKLLKWFGYCLLGLTLILVAGVIVLQVYKKEILASINEGLKENFNGDVNIGNYNITLLHDFPNISVELTDIYLRGPAYSKYRRPFLKAQHVDINVQPLKLLTKTISIKSIDVVDGEIFVFRTASGYTNLDVFKKSESNADTTGTTNSMPLDLRAINLKRVMVNYDDSLKRKHYGVHFVNTKNSINTRDSSLSIHIGGQLEFKGLMFNARKGSFLKNKLAKTDLNVEFDKKNQKVSLVSSSLEFEKSTVRLAGSFLLGKPASFQLDIQSDELNFDEGLTIVSDTLAKRLSAYHVDRPIKLRVILNGIMEPNNQPDIDVAFSFRNSKASAPKLAMTGLSVDGVFKNHMDDSRPSDDVNSQLKFSFINGLINKLPVKASATINNLSDPSLELKATFDIALRKLNEHLDTLKVKMFGGRCISTFEYKGKLREYLNDNSPRYDGKLKGVATITNGHFRYLSRKIRVNNIDATFGFTEKRFDIRKLNLQLNKNKLSIKGFISDFIPFFTNPNTTSKVNLSLTSPRLDISGLVQPRKIKRTKMAKKASKQKVADTIEKLNEELEFDLDFNIGQFINKNFKASNLKGRLLLADNKFNARDVTMDFANGKVELNLNVRNLERAVTPLALEARLRNVGIRDFFFSFDNFNQNTFSYEHVDGALNLDLNLRGEMDDNLQFLTHRMEGTANFSIQNGRLRNFEPMQRLSNFLLKGRDFSDVQFGEITSDISITGSKVDVSRMEVESTVLTMFIEGRYDIKDSSDLSIQVPLSNLKKRDQNFAPENIGTDSKVGPSVFLRVRPDKNGKTAISYDMFKKLRKKKKES